MHFALSSSWASKLRLALLGPVAFALILQATPACAGDSLVPGIGPLLGGRSAGDVTPRATKTPLERDSAPTETYDDSILIPVNDFTISGNSVLSQAQLRPLLTHLLGKSWTLAQLMTEIQSIAAFYEQAGYPLVSTNIPEQTLDAGILKLEVLEPVWGEVQIETPTKPSARLLQLATAHLNKGQTIRQSDIDRSTSLLGDIAGLAVQARLKPGMVLGSTNLVLDAAAASPITGELTAHNFGGAATGRTQANLHLQLNGVAGFGESAAIDGLSSGDGLNSLRSSLELPLPIQAMRIGAAQSKVRYQLVGESKFLGAHGWAQQSSLWIRHALLPVAAANMTARMQWDTVDLDDLMNVGAEMGNRRTLNLWGLALGGEVADNWHLGGRTRWSLGLTRGQVAFHTEAAQANDAALADTQGGFTRVNITGSHTRELTQLDTLNASLDVQWANRNLDVSQKASLGGARSVRAYESGVLSGDASMLLILEMKRAWGDILGVRWTGLVFADYGWVKTNAKPWSDTDNEASIASIGLGLQGTVAQQWALSLSIANSIGALPAVLQGSQSRHGGIWLEFSKSLSW